MTIQNKPNKSTLCWKVSQSGSGSSAVGFDPFT